MFKFLIHEDVLNADYEVVAEAGALLSPDDVDDLYEEFRIDTFKAALIWVE